MPPLPRLLAGHVRVPSRGAVVIVSAVLIGIVVGVVVGSLGAGGGILSVPVLVYVSGSSMLGGLAGAQLTTRVSNRVLGLVFAALLVCVAVSTLAATLA